MRTTLSPHSTAEHGAHSTTQTTMACPIRRRRGRGSASWLALALYWPWLAFAAPRLLDDTAAVTAVFVRVEERLALMPRVAAAKWQAGARVVDPAREHVVLERAAASAAALGLSGSAALASLQVRLARESQVRYHTRWREQGCSVATGCSVALPLEDLRQQLDRLAGELLHALYLAAPAIAEPNFSHRYGDLAERLLAASIPLAADRAQLLAALGTLRQVGLPGWARVRASGMLRLGVSGDYAPFSLVKNGQLRGADIELGLALAHELGLEPIFVATGWPTLLSDLADERFDVALGGVSVTPERAAVGLFSKPYYTGGKTILARCTERARLNGLAALDSPEVRVIVNPGGTNERYVREHLRAAHILVYPDNRSIFKEIAAARADAMITDDVEVDLQVRRHPTLCRTFPGTLTRADKALLMPPDPALKLVVDRWLQKQLTAGVPARLIKQFSQP
ncbi:MAG: transporter substrate-binding domain-containing protein [Gammaproteobacteria bacterium]|nr:transporter substrate-binding domain-containing protein [Gammaproteobacteria bacterium]